MPISTPLKSSLEEGIRKAFEDSRESGKKENPDSDKIIKDLAKAITDAIDEYILGMVVTVTVQPGQSVLVPAVAVVGGTITTEGTGTTTTPGTGTT